MEKFRKIWDSEKNNWIIEHKALKREEAYELFIQKWPDSQVTYTAFNNQRSRLKACAGTRPQFCTRKRPLLSEQVKKGYEGYVRIKVAQPNVWIPKSRYVYEQAHPEFVHNGHHYLYLDGNNRNFEPDNIAPIPKQCVIMFQHFGGVVKGNPEATKMNLTRALLKYEILNAGEKIGAARNYNGSRVFYDEFKEKNNRRAKELRKDPEARERLNAIARKRHKKKWAQMTEEEKQEFREKRRAYLKEYYKRKREEKK